MAKTIKITSNNEISVVDVDFDDYRAIQKVVGGMFETVKTQRMFDYFGKPVSSGATISSYVGTARIKSPTMGYP